VDSSQAAAARATRLLTRGRDHGDKGQKLEEEHGEKASPEDAEREARGKEEQEVASDMSGESPIAAREAPLASPDKDEPILQPDT
jgi:hypothetical protein